MRTACLLPYGGLPNRDTPWTETPKTETPTERPPGQRPTQTETSLVMWPVVNAGTETPPPMNRMTHGCKNITMPQLRCGREKRNFAAPHIPNGLFIQNLSGNGTGTETNTMPKYRAHLRSHISCSVKVWHNIQWPILVPVPVPYPHKFCLN